MTTETKPDIVIPPVERQRSFGYVPPDRPIHHGLPQPPDHRHPVWAYSGTPERDPAGKELFADDYDRADRWWAWAKETRAACAGRAQRGYAYLSRQEKPEPEDVALFRNLVRTVAWCDAALWVATTWYSPAGMTQRPTSLTLPFAGYVDADGDGSQVVRELNGLPGYVLIEDAMADWHQLALSTGYLNSLEED